MCAWGSVLSIDLIGKSISWRVNVCACMWKERERRISISVFISVINDAC